MNNVNAAKDTSQQLKRIFYPNPSIAWFNILGQTKIGFLKVVLLVSFVSFSMNSAMSHMMVNVLILECKNW